MIGRLRGRVLDTALGAGGALVVDVGGVGYELSAPLGTRERLGLDDEGHATLFVHTNVREDALELYGFSTLEERAAFRTLIGVSKVGPKLALAILSALSVTELTQVVASGDAARLTKVPGVGRKTAERLVLELDGKIATAPAPRAAAAPAPGPSAGAPEPRLVLHEALVRMGFRPSEAERAVASMEGFERPMGELVREALALLAP